MTITTSMGKTFNVDWAWAPVGSDKRLMIQYEDARRISEIAGDFDGLQSIIREDENEGDATYTGYSALVSVIRYGDKVQIALKRGDDS